MLSTEQLYTAYHSELRLFIRSKVKDMDIANDLLQEVFLKVHTKLHQLRQKDKVRSWLFRISRNVVNEYYRNRPAFVSLPPFEIASGEQSGSVNAELLNCLLPLLGKLPLRFREAITRVDLEGDSQLELAESTGISHSGARSRVQRGRTLLKAALEKCCGISNSGQGCENTNIGLCHTT
jgi:RNA polymerase sigma-70 factor, ECF subfamily